MAAPRRAPLTGVQGPAVPGGVRGGAPEQKRWKGPAFGLQVPIDRITANPDDTRTRKSSRESLQAMAETLRRGQMAPVAGELLDDGRVQLVYGSRRLEAAKLAGLTHLWVVPVAGMPRVSPLQRLVANIVENTSRVGLTPYEKAMAFEKLSAEVVREEPRLRGLNLDRKVATLVGVPAVTVSEYRRFLAQAHPRLLALWRDAPAVVNIELMRRLTRKPPEIQVELVEQLIAKRRKSELDTERKDSVDRRAHAKRRSASQLRVTLQLLKGREKNGYAPGHSEDWSQGAEHALEYALGLTEFESEGPRPPKAPDLPKTRRRGKRVKPGHRVLDQLADDGKPKTPTAAPPPRAQPMADDDLAALEGVQEWED